MTLKQVKLFNLFVLTFAVSFVIFIVLPKGREIYDLQKKIEITKIKIVNGKRALMHQPNLKKQVSIQGSLLQRISQLFIHEQEQPVVYQIINETAKKTNVTILSLKPQPQDISEEITLGPKIIYKKLPLRIEVTGYYTDLATFMNNLSRAKKYFTFQDVTYQHPENKKDPIKAVLVMDEYLLVNYE
ncbi:MAG: type 4a pilus biogenesis protein PilO [Candidatus Aureabacteria bacterium]|nr:type 4a pilus biogenesis protein PilO [Candidatus Auribacterota bacterium]